MLNTTKKNWNEAFVDTYAAIRRSLDDEMRESFVSDPDKYNLSRCFQFYFLSLRIQDT